MDRPLEFSISHTLRMEWVACQKKDPECLGILRLLDRRKEQKSTKTDKGLAPRTTEEFRRAGDGLLEKKVPDLRPWAA